MFQTKRIYIAGVDEVGRGALAGPVIAAAVILNIDNPIMGRLLDSKKLSNNRRIILFDEIKKKSLEWNIGRANADEIDRLNILNATLLAMQRAILGLHITPDIVLIDGNHIPKLSIPTKAIIKGDNLIMQISAASILAKVTRDREMMQMDVLYPKYSFSQHKGYPTALHIDALIKYGITPYHRLSFRPVLNSMILKCK